MTRKKTKYCRRCGHWIRQTVWHNKPRPHDRCRESWWECWLMCKCKPPIVCKGKAEAEVVSAAWAKTTTEVQTEITKL